MDNKVTKERVINHLEYDWFKYLILLAAVLFLIIFSFNQVNLTRDEEQIDFFIGSYSSFSNDYESSVLAGMNSESYDKSLYGNPIVSEVKLNFQSPLSSEFSMMLTTNGFISSDVLIADWRWFFKEDEATSASGFVEFDSQILALMGIDESKYEFLRLDEKGFVTQSGGRIYGIKVAGLPKIKSLAVFEGNEEEDIPDLDAYLFVISKKPNVALGGNAQTFYCLKKFFEKYGV